MTYDASASVIPARPAPLTLALVAGLEWTRFGAQVRAAVDNQRMARGLGLDVELFTNGTGTLQIGNDGATGSLGTGDVINNGTLRFDRTGTLTVPEGMNVHLYSPCVEYDHGEISAVNGMP